MHHAPAAVAELTVEQFQDHTTSEESAEQWRAVAHAVAQIGLQSALHLHADDDVLMDSDDEEKGTSAASPVSRRDVSKSSLWFILDDDDETPRVDAFQQPQADMGPPSMLVDELEEKPLVPPFVPFPSSAKSQDAKREATNSSSDEIESHVATKRRKVSRRSSATPVPTVAVAAETASMPPAKRTERKRKARRRPPSRICKFDGCEQYVVDQGLCVRHGGGKRCQTEGCTSRAKHQGKCWKHGGSTACKVVGCPNRAKSRGYCWSHGGGTKCKTGSCEKIAISNGLCWAHGGGKRCIIDGCRRQAYERTQNYCNTHYSELVASPGAAHEHDEDDEEDEEPDWESQAADRKPLGKALHHR